METPVERPSMPVYSRALSDNELSYFLPSRANGANDMILQMIFRAPVTLMTHWRISLAWAIIRVQHPLLASKIEMTPGEYHTPRFVYVPPASPHDAIIDAQSNFDIPPNKTPAELADDASNMPRVLSAERTSYLTLSGNSNVAEPVGDYSFVFHFAHYSIDGVSAHSLCNLLFALLGGSALPGQPVRSDEELEELLQRQWNQRWSSIDENRSVIPSPAETRLPPIVKRFKAVASRAEFNARQDRFIGGHVFPRVPAKTQRSVGYDIQFTVAETSLLLAKCRAERVTVSNALFVICSFAWIRTMQNRPAYDPKLPLMMYSAMSLRHFFSKPEVLVQPSPLLPADTQLESFVFLAVSYFNAILPAFIPSTVPESAVFWSRARWIRQQLSRYMQSPMLIPRVHHMTVDRGIRARRFAKEDDRALLPHKPAVPVGHSPSKPVPTVAPIQPKTASGPSPSPLPVSFTSPQTQTPRAPSAALIGLSQLNNLDEIYMTRLYPSFDISFVGGHTRKNKGGMLFFSHTFRGRLCLTFGWDRPSFEPGVVETYWQTVQDCIREFMINTREEEGDLKSSGRKAKL